jgi:hypothetical protein
MIWPVPVAGGVASSRQNAACTGSARLHNQPALAPTEQQFSFLFQFRMNQTFQAAPRIKVRI